LSRSFDHTVVRDKDAARQYRVGLASVSGWWHNVIAGKGGWSITVTVRLRAGLARLAGTPRLQRAADLLEMTVPEVKNWATITGAIEIGRLAGPAGQSGAPRPPAAETRSVRHWMR
jgi:hypothetical protein